jgi:nucleoside-diphosphate-sugar epimerase/intein/homing endonuclease
MANMRILVTGGAGFLGSHLVERLLAEGHDVIAMDNLITGSTDNIAHLAGNPHFSFIHHNVTNYIYLKGDLDAILHFASPASPVDYLELPIQTLKVGSLGTHNALGLALAKGARFLLASTSEVYGDPLVHPQTEEYWGHVNPIGPRGVYDEAKRFAEAMTMAYHRTHGVQTRIVRIFNSVLADETLFFFNDDTCHLQTAEEYADQIEQRQLWTPLHIQVPAFDPKTLTIQLRAANAFIKHAALGNDAFVVRTRYGRHIKVTGDHSLFVRGKQGEPVPLPVRQLSVGDYVAIPARLPVVEDDVNQINLGERIIEITKDPERLWEYALVSPALSATLIRHKERIYDFLMRSTRFNGSRNKRNTVGCCYRKYLHQGLLPLAVIAELQRTVGFEWPEGARLRPYAGTRLSLPNSLPVSEDLLWLLGLYLAEGSCYSRSGTHALQICSDEAFVLRAKTLFEQIFQVNPGFVSAQPGRGPTVYANSRLLCKVFTEIFGMAGYSRERRIAPWIMQLPLSRLKYFLEGYRQGDGTHTKYYEKRELAFNTSSERLATDLIYLLLRFGIVASLGEYKTTYKQRYGERTFPFWRVTVCELSNFDILSWDRGVEQCLNAKRAGDLVWAAVTAIEPTAATSYVYDFSVPDHENFVAGVGIFAHNTYGPRMRLNDGRVVPNFMSQALAGKPLTVYGDGSQTRSFCYVNDLVDGIYRLLLSDETEPVNIGNPIEITIREFAERINALTGNPAGIRFEPLPKDDPRQRQPDISKARRVLGWSPQVQLQDGLEKTVAWFADRVKV